MTYARCQNSEATLVFAHLYLSVTFSLFVGWFQSGLIRQPIVFSSYNKLALAELIRLTGIHNPTVALQRFPYPFSSLSLQFSYTSLWQFIVVDWSCLAI